MRTAVAIGIMLLVGLLLALMLYLLVRRAVLRWITWIVGRREAMLRAALQPWLSGTAQDPPPVLHRMRRWPDRRIFVELCLAALPQADSATRTRILDWLEHNGHIDEWIRDLGHRDPWRRERAAELLGIARPPRAVEPLLEALEDPRLDVRMRVAAALGSLGGRRARHALIAALTDENRWSTIRIADLLSAMGREVSDEVLQAFQGMGQGARLAAIDLLARLGDDRTGPFIVALLAADDSDIRSRAAAALGRLAYRPALPELRKALEDSAWPVRAMAAKSLGLMRDEDAVPGLCAGLRDPEWWVRANSAVALKNLGLAGREALRGMRTDDDRFARDQALAILEALETAP